MAKNKTPHKAPEQTATEGPDAHTAAGGHTADIGVATHAEPLGTPSTHLQPATGQQWSIDYAGARVQVCALAAGLRSYRVGGVALVNEYDDAQIAPAGAGITLAPWPNRVAGAQWNHEGKVQNLDITERALGNAIHGLLRNTGYQLEDLSANAITLLAHIYPQHGFPFHLEHRVRYLLDEQGVLHVRQELTNVGTGTAPVALGAHPYLCLGESSPSELSLTLPAHQKLINDASNIPVGRAPVDSPVHIEVGVDQLDNCFTQIEQSAGEYQAILRNREGQSVTLFSDQNAPYIQVYLTDAFPGYQRAIAVEPMSAPANAYNSGEGLRWIGPHESFAINWGIRASI